MLQPTNEQELAAALGDAASRRDIVRLGGGFSKDRMGPAIPNPARTISTTAMNRVLQYEPRDLTISVEAGMRWADLTRLLAENRQMIPLDPPHFDAATVGGVVAANTCGPRRRLYGSARDLVIGMRFATLEGKVVQSGGMVVKNVAGLDMAKLMIGSFGTLAAIAVVNFKLAPEPLESQTFLLRFDTAAACIEARDRMLKGVLQPSALDILNPAAARLAGVGHGYTMLVQAGGNSAMLARYTRELGVCGDPAFDWTGVREFTPRYLAANPAACVAKVSSKLAQVAEVLAHTDAPIVSRAGNGISYIHFPAPPAAPLPQHWRYVFEAGITADANVFGPEFAIMTKLKQMFDPQRILNPGRLYGRL